VTTADTQNVLDQMVGNIMAAKRNAATKLTPVGTEQGSRSLTAEPLGRTDAPFPADHPSESILGAVGEMRLQVARIVEALDAVERQLGVELVGVSDKAVAWQKTKTAEQAADAAHAQRLAASTPEVVPPLDTAAMTTAVLTRLDRVSAEAQAATFTQPNRFVGDGRWRCPLHNLGVMTKSRKGREYMVCPADGCGEFERLVG